MWVGWQAWETETFDPFKAEHESRLLTGTHGLTRENTHHELDPWIQIYSQWQIPKDPGLTFGEQNCYDFRHGLFLNSLSLTSSSLIRAASYFFHNDIIPMSL